MLEAFIISKEVNVNAFATHIFSFINDSINLRRENIQAFLRSFIQVETLNNEKLGFYLNNEI